jgi:hypothetical protein
MPKVTKNLLTRDEAFALAPEYVTYVEFPNERRMKGEDPNAYWRAFDKVSDAMNGMKRGQACLTCAGACAGEVKQYVKCKVSSTKMTWRSEDGPEVRVSNGEFSWRVDGCDYAYPIAEKK